MVTVTYDHDVYTGASAAKNDHEFAVYDENRKELHHVRNIYDDEWNCISIQNGEWLDMDTLPAREDIVDGKIEKLQADLDYCLMLLEE